MILIFVCFSLGGHGKLGVDIFNHTIFQWPVKYM